MDRRAFIKKSVFLTASVLAGPYVTGLSFAQEEGEYEVMYTEDQWRKKLTPEQFNILRKEGTEPPGSSPLNLEKRQGTYLCAACNLPLYNSQSKYESGTGWPSFFDPLPNAVKTKLDYRLFFSRTEVHCRRCGGHLGHVFDDGPAPTGKRYCMNGVAMKFIPDEKGL